ncbi:hypothetical protein EUX98_g1786 [Antrodiella citrinella]|uniref:Cytochrome P450 n=1 Tax=Antrodiella citrinella TaxID=2447956 RepID=A0A4V3XJD3_9APHY|nr:hypothetical protein EUX98_g1786 [Antrodiella citrinella]
MNSLDENIMIAVQGLGRTFFLVLIPCILSTLLATHFSVPIAVGVAFVGYLATLLSSITVYRLSPFHPLARYPGPLRLKLSSYFVYKMGQTGQRHRYIQKLHEQYASDTIRIGPNQLSIRDVTAISSIMGTKGLSKGPGESLNPFLRASALNHYIAYDGRASYDKHRTLLAWRDAVMHTKQRIPWTRGMSSAAVKEYEPALADRVAQLVGILLSSDGEEVEMTELIKYFSFDFMGDMAFGGQSELMREGDKDGHLRILHAAFAILAESIPWLTLYSSNGLSKLKDLTSARAKQRLLNGCSRKDIFYYLNNDDIADKVNPPIHTVAIEAFLVTIAGSDTVYSTLCNTLSLLMQNPAIYNQLQDEIDRYYPLGENALDCKYHTDMTFMNAVIYIPPYTSVRVHTWSVHRDPRNFSPFTEQFWPERWLIAEDFATASVSTRYNSKEPFVHNPNAFIPFSFGPANCVGKNLALKEMKMVLCHLLQQIELQFAKGYDPITEKPTSLPENSVLIRVHRFGFSANNITYQALGETPNFRYFEFHDAPEAGAVSPQKYGMIPVWGFGVVEASTSSIQVGERVYGYFAPARYVVVAVDPTSITTYSFLIPRPHLPADRRPYNQVNRCAGDPLYDPHPVKEDLTMLYRPLFWTSFWCEDWLFHGFNQRYRDAKRFIITSASAKTAFALAYCIKRRAAKESELAGVKIIGLTSKKNLEFTKNLHLYDSVFEYSSFSDNLDVSGKEKWIFADVAGNDDLNNRILRHFVASGAKDKLITAIQLGLTTLAPAATSKAKSVNLMTLPETTTTSSKVGAAPQDDELKLEPFFTVEWLAHRRAHSLSVAQIAVMQAEAWGALMEDGKNWVRIERIYGAEKVKTEYERIRREGFGPDIGQIWSLWDENQVDLSVKL